MVILPNVIIGSHNGIAVIVKETALSASMYRKRIYRLIAKKGL